MFFHENDVRLISIKRGGRVEGCTGRVVVCRRRCRRSGARKHYKLEAAPVRARGPPSERQLGQAGWQTEEEEGGRVITLRFSCSLSFPPLMFGIQKKSKGKRSFFSHDVLTRAGWEVKQERIIGESLAENCTDNMNMGKSISFLMFVTDVCV